MGTRTYHHSLYSGTCTVLIANFHSLSASTMSWLSLSELPYRTFEEKLGLFKEFSSSSQCKPLGTSCQSSPLLLYFSRTYPCQNEKRKLAGSRKEAGDKDKAYASSLRPEYSTRVWSLWQWTSDTFVNDKEHGELSLHWHAGLDTWTHRTIELERTSRVI